MTGLNNGALYYVVVTARNAGGESAASTPASATPVAAPLSLTAGNAQVEATWNPVSGATGYTLYYSASSLHGLTLAQLKARPGITRVADVTSPRTIAGLTNGATYTVVVTAGNAGGEGPPSAPASAIPIQACPAASGVTCPPPPGSPSGLGLSAGDTRATATWTAVSGATGYTLYYSPTSLNGLTLARLKARSDITRVSNLTGASHTVTGLTNATRYYAVVTARNARGEGAPSAEASVTPQAAARAPSAPSIQNVSAGNAQATVRWATVSDAFAYNLYYSESSFAGVTDLAGDGITKAMKVSAPHSVTGLGNFTRYYFVVTAENSAGESAASTEVSATPRLPDGSVFRDALSGGGEGPDMVVLPTGSFRMGSATENLLDNDERPVRTVTMGKRFAMGRYEVTFADYDRFARATRRTQPGDQVWGRGTRPVINVNRADAQAYATWLSTQTGKTYRLPSEAEWEYAARAGTTTAYAFGASIRCDQANFGRFVFFFNACNTANNASLSRTVVVGSFVANAFGLYDMHGNVSEWVQDCYVNTYTGAPSDGSARTTVCGRTVRAVLRGGDWGSGRRFVRSADRSVPSSPSVRRNDSGFRLVRELSP